MTSLPDARAPLSPDQAGAAFAAILDARASDEAIVRFLVTLADRGESADEIAAAAMAMRARMVPIASPVGAIDVCGTGGDGQHTVNVSTAVALVVAACDVAVAKHGNRAASSQSGAADTLEALGLDLAKAATQAEATLANIGICFLFAPRYHPALVGLHPIRKTIGRRTIFNLLGPLANPAGVTRQLIGVAHPDLVPTYAAAVAQLAPEKVFVVSGAEGLDELSIAGPSHVAIIDPTGITHQIWTPDDAHLPRHPLTALQGGDAAYNAAALRALLDGEPGAYRDAVLFNAAAALVLAGAADTLPQAAEEAAEAIDKGLAKALLACWIAAT